MKQFVMICVLVVLLFGGLPTSIYGDAWKTEDKILMVTFLVANVIDTLQTKEIVNNKRFNELMPGVNDATGAIVEGVVTALIVWLVAKNNPEYRTPILVGANVLKWGFIIHNDCAGVRISF